MKNYLMILVILLGKVVDDFCNLSFKESSETYLKLLDRFKRFSVFLLPPVMDENNSRYFITGILFINAVISLVVLVTYLLLK